MPRWAAKADDNQAALVKELRQYGVTVQHLHRVGQGCPDILCGWQGANWLFEIKDPAKPPSARKLTTDEIAWHDQWRGQCATITTAEEAVQIMRGGSRLVPIGGQVVGDRVLK